VLFTAFIVRHRPVNSFPQQSKRSRLCVSVLPISEGRGPHIYIPHKKDSPVIPPGIGFPFRRRLRLTGLGRSSEVAQLMASRVVFSYIALVS
jgi:hypothetical protein